MVEKQEVMRARLAYIGEREAVEEGEVAGEVKNEVQRQLESRWPGRMAMMVRNIVTLHAWSFIRWPATITATVHRCNCMTSRQLSVEPE